MSAFPSVSYFNGATGDSKDCDVEPDPDLFYKALKDSGLFLSIKDDQLKATAQGVYRTKKGSKLARKIYDSISSTKSSRIFGVSKYELAEVYQVDFNKLKGRFPIKFELCYLLWMPVNAVGLYALLNGKLSSTFSAEKSILDKFGPGLYLTDCFASSCGPYIQSTYQGNWPKKVFLPLFLLATDEILKIDTVSSFQKFVKDGVTDGEDTLLIQGLRHCTKAHVVPFANFAALLPTGPFSRNVHPVGGEHSYYRSSKFSQMKLVAIVQLDFADQTNT